LTWGNHDLSAEENPAEAAAIVQRFAEREIRVLVNQTVRLAGAVIYGAPYSNPFGDWAFMPTEAAQDNLFANIPDDADVVFTHGPPFGYGDCVVSGQDVGSVALLNRLWYVRPRYAFCGHIHEAHGRYKVDWGPDSLRETVVFNVSVLDEKYRVRNLPVVVDL
jgi:Icc-related predicted phosphoesterase